MARQARIEYEGAFYHVMSRGDRREAIFEDEEDREMYLRTLGECCERSGWRIYAYVLMSNHYHWVLNTPTGNLVAGMKWFQNTYTRRLNTRHGKWGHVFGGRYKAVVVESAGGNYLETLMDYVHLNPVRAGLVKAEEGKGLLEYRWSSLATGYGVMKGRRPKWLAVEEGLELFGYGDEARERRKFVERLEERAREDKGLVESPHEGMQNTLERGWYWGSQKFREKLLKLLKKPSGNRNYRANEMGRQRDRREAKEWTELAKSHFGVEGEVRNASRTVRLAAAWALHHRTNQPQGWIAEKLGLRSAANVSQQVRRIDAGLAKKLSQEAKWKSWEKFVKNC